jgi:uncharacterized GH25 family protein
MRKIALGLMATAAALALPQTASAHRQWLLPTATTLSGDDPWVDVDAAVSNDLFYPDHFPLQLSQVKVTQPDGSEGKLEHGVTGRHRSTFDVHLTQEGTWRIGTASSNIMGSFKVDGVEKRVGRRPGPPAGAFGPNGGPAGGPNGGPAVETVSIDAIPANATDIKLTESISRNDIFVTRGKPTTNLFTPTGKGLEFVPVTHPDDLVAGQPAKFRFLIDGKPAVGLKLEIIPGGKRYRDAEDGFSVTTDAQGVATINWKGAGMYWFTTSASDKNPSDKRATDRRMSYTATVEVQAL